MIDHSQQILLSPWGTSVEQMPFTSSIIPSYSRVKCTYKLIFKQKLKEIREWGLFTEREGRAANPQHLQILRADREGMIDDVICAKKAL